MSGYRGSGPDLKSGDSEHLCHSGSADKVHHAQSPALLRYAPQLVLSGIVISKVRVEVGYKWERGLKQDLWVPLIDSKERGL